MYSFFFLNVFTSWVFRWKISTRRSRWEANSCENRYERPWLRRSGLMAGKLEVKEPGAGGHPNKTGTIKLPSSNLTWQWKMDPLKMYFLLKMRIFHCYVSLPEGTLNYLIWDQRMQTYGDFKGSPKNESAWFWVVTYFLGGIKECKYVTPLKFNMTSPLKNDSWKSILSFWGEGLFSGASCWDFQGVW